MDTEKLQKIKSLFIKIKEGHRYYESGDNDYRIRLSKAFEPIFIQLETLGVARHFSEALLIWGKEFVDSVVLESRDRKEATIEDAEAIFGAEAHDMTDEEKRNFELAQKNDALVYRSIGPGKIEILAKKGGAVKPEAPKLSLRERFSQKNKSSEKQESLL